MAIPPHSNPRFIPLSAGEGSALPDLFPCKAEVQGEKGLQPVQALMEGRAAQKSSIIPRILIYGAGREEGREMAAGINSTSTSAS